MTVEEIRLANLELLIKELGTIAAVAKAAGTAPSYLSQIRTGAPSRTGKPRSIGTPLARKLEDGCGKPRGWMDQPHDIPGGLYDDRALSALTEDERQVLDAYRALAPDDRAKWRISAWTRQLWSERDLALMRRQVEALALPEPNADPDGPPHLWLIRFSVPESLRRERAEALYEELLARLLDARGLRVERLAHGPCDMLIRNRIQDRDAITMVELKHTARPAEIPAGLPPDVRLILLESDPLSR